MDPLDQLVLTKDLLTGLGSRGVDRRLKRRRARIDPGKGIDGRAFGSSGGRCRFKDKRVCAVGAQYRSS